MKKKTQYLLWAVFVLMVGVCIWLNSGENTNDVVNTAISVIMLIVVGALYAYATYRFNRIDEVVSELTEVSSMIRSDFDEASVYLWGNGYSEKGNLFQCKHLHDKYEEFYKENERLERLSGGNIHCDVENYINHGIIDDCIDRNVLNLISGTMTGLGILGTFVGLTLGLQSFNTGTADAITKSIGPLIQGIKVAFHTSIYGMFFSIFFSFAYRGKLNEASRALDDFLTAFTSFVMPNPENDTVQKMLSYQEKQAQGIDVISETFGDKVAEKLSAVMAPQFERMNSTIEAFTEIASESQVQGVEKIVSKFIESMNNSLGNQFAELERVIAETVEWQKKNSADMAEILTRVEARTSDIQKIDELTKGIVADLAGFMNSLKEMQQLTVKNIETVNTQIEAEAKISEQQQGYIEKLVDCERNISESMQGFLDKVIEQMNNLQKLSESLEETSKANLEAISAAASSASEAITEHAKNQIEDLGNTSKAVNEASRSTVEELRNVARTQVATFSDMSEAVTSAIAATAEKSTGEVTETSRKQIEDIREMSASLNEKMRQSLSEIAETSKKQIESIETATASISADLDKSADNLTKAAQLLNDNSSAKLNETFDIFDKNLADISRHLSGTISQVEATTGQVPKVVSAAYEGMEGSFERMQEELRLMVRGMDALKRTIAGIMALDQDE